MTSGTASYPAIHGALAADGVYVPQDDSLLLVEAMSDTGLVPGRRVLDLCTGSGVIAIAAAELGAASVAAFDICPRAVRCSRRNALRAGVVVDVREGPLAAAFDCAPSDVIVSNPPYVPTPKNAGPIAWPAGPQRSWDGGVDGRLVLDPLCRAAASLLRCGGSLLLVQSTLADVARSLDLLRLAGLDAEVIADTWIEFGPVLSARASWLERCGRIPRGCREERLVVIRADKP